MIDADVSANPRAERWQQYLDDLHAYASVPLPLHTQGTLVRVAGLVLEAAGVRVAATPSEIGPLLAARLKPDF